MSGERERPGAGKPRKRPGTAKRPAAPGQDGTAGPRRPAPRKAAPKKAVPEKSAPKKAAPKKAVPKKAAPGGTVPKKTARPRGPVSPSGAPLLRLAGARPRLRLVSVLLTVVLLVFVGRLLQVQAVDASAYATKAAGNRYMTVTLSAERGTLTDRNGVALATTVDAYDIIADPSMFTPDQSKVPDAPAQAAELLAPIVGQEEEAVARKLAEPDSRYVVLARKQTPQVWNQIKDLKAALAEEAARDRRGAPGVLAGVFSESTSKRVYPADELAAGVIGFVNAEDRGGAGLEAALDGQLAGKEGLRTYTQSGGRLVPTAGVREKPAEPGTDFELTLDRDIQWAAEDAIGEQVAESGADRGYVIVQDTSSGEILAMANAPGYDPGDLTRADPAALSNRALEDAFEPGSTSKLMSMAAVLEEGVAAPDTHVTVPGTLPRADRVFHDDVDHGTWYLTLNGVLAKSSNIGTILAVEQLGKTRKETNRILHRYLTGFGIGRPTGLEFPGETPGILAAPGKWDASQQYTIPFGQGLSVNALQATSVFSTIANGGVRVQPSLVRGTTGPDGRYTPAGEPKRTRVVSEKTARTLSRMLESVVGDEQGTGVKAQIAGYRVAGKTGTANRVDPETGRYRGYTASFMGFAPADDPKVTVSCVIQNPTRGSYFGGQICGPVFKEVMEFALKSLHAPPSGANPPALPVEFDPEKQ